MYCDKYKKNMLISIKTAFMYRENFLISIVMRLIVVVLTLYLWKAIYAGQNQVGGFDFTEMIIYIFFSNFIYGLGNFDDYSYQLVESILQGKISYYILRPVSYGKMSFFESIGQKLVYAPIDFLAYIVPLIGVLLCNNYFLAISMPVFLFIFVMTVGGIIVGFLTSFIFGILAFYIENPTVLIFIKGEIFSLLSGSIIPLNMFPNGLRGFFEILPIKYIGYYQSSLLLGKSTARSCIYNAILLAFWICFLVVLACHLWKKALNKYIANGG